MFRYFTERLVFTLAMLWTVFILCTIGIDQWYLKRYQDVKITKEKKEWNSNYCGELYTVEFDCVGKSDKKQYHFVEYYPRTDHYEYKELKTDKTYSTVTWYGLVTWIGEIGILTISMFTLMNMSEAYYYKEEKEYIIDANFKLWKFLFKFIGYDKETQEKVIQEMEKLVDNAKLGLRNCYFNLEEFPGIVAMCIESAEIMSKLKKEKL